MKFKTVIKDIMKDISLNKFYYLFNVLVIHLFISFIGKTLLSLSFRLILLVSNIEALTQTNFTKVIFNPISALIAVVFILIFVFLIYFEFASLVYMFYKKDFSIKNNFIEIIKHFKKYLGLESFVYFVILVQLNPFTLLGTTSVILNNVYIPRFIIDELLKSPIWIVTFILIGIIHLYLSFKTFYVLPLSLINDRSLKENIKLSFELTKKYKIKILLLYISLGFIYSLVFLLAKIAIIVIIVLFEQNLNNIILQTILYSLLVIFNSLAYAYNKIIIISLVLNVLSKQEVISIKRSEKINFKFSKLIVSFGTLIYLYVLFNTYVNLFLSDNNYKQVIIAHRGYVKNAVENSIEALKEAKKYGADYVEFDIIMTKDKKFIVLHDYNLNRLAGINKQVKDMNYDELVSLSLKQNGFISKIPSLKEYVLEAQKLGIDLIFELKPHGYEGKDYIDLFIKELESLNIQENYRYMSIDYDVIKQLETKKPELKTGFVIPVLFGTLNYQDFDFYAIEDFSYQDIFSYQTNAVNKEIYIWTVNDSIIMEKYLNSAVNGIISDEIEELSTLKQEYKTGDTFISKALKMLEE